MSRFVADRVYARWGLPFWNLVWNLHDQGLNRTQAAQAIGCSFSCLQRTLSAHPDLDPFECPSPFQAYMRDTGEGFRAALERMARENYTLAAASQVIGYATPEGLREAMNSRGIHIRFERFDAIGEYERKHGLDLATVLERMSARGVSRAGAARAIGLNSSAALRYQMKVRGIAVEFPGPKRYERKASGEPHPWRRQAAKEIANRAP